MRERLDEVALAQIRRIDAELARTDLDQPLDHEGRFRPPGAAIRIDRHGVGVDRIDLAIDVRDAVLARQQGRVEIGRHRRREGRHVGAEIGDGLRAQAGDLAFGVERHLGMGDVVAAVRVGEEGFGAIRIPLHRPVHLARRPEADDLFRIDEDLRAEAAADVRRDHAQLVLRRHADEGRDHEARDVRVLRRVPQRQRVVAGIVIGERGARLDRVRHQAVVDDVELGDVLGARERRLGRLLVAEMPLVDRVVRRDVMDQRRALRLRLRRIGDRGQHLVIDVDLLARVLRLRQGLGDHDRDRVADVVRLVAGDRRMRRHLHRRAVLRRDRPAADQIADLVGREIGAGQHRDDAGHAFRFGAVDLLDLRVRVRRADEIDVGLARAVDVVGVLALAGDEPVVFLAADCRADPGRAHGVSSSGIRLGVS